MHASPKVSPGPSSSAITTLRSARLSFTATLQSVRYVGYVVDPADGHDVRCCSRVGLCRQSVLELLIGCYNCKYHKVCADALCRRFTIQNKLSLSRMPIATAMAYTRNCSHENNSKQKAIQWTRNDLPSPLSSVATACAPLVSNHTASDILNLSSYTSGRLLCRRRSERYQS